MDWKLTPVSSATVADGWHFAYDQSRSLPPLAWIAEVGSGEVRVRCGTSVRCTPVGFVEGTWVGPADIARLADSTCVFGSGMVGAGEQLVAVPPSHPLERIYLHREEGTVVVANSIAAVLETRGLELDPNIAYPPIFVAAADGVRNPYMDIPTDRGPVMAAVYYNFDIGRDGSVTVAGRPREWPFTSFEDFRARIEAALRSAAANAPGYEMAVSLSSGYDSTAVAAVAAVAGCRHALSFREGKPISGGHSTADSGELAARQLGMSIETFDRLDYLRRDDLPEAEFLATGMNGEDVVVSAMEAAVRRRVLLTGAEEFRLKGGPRRSALYRGDLSSCSLTEFRLRTDFVHLPLLFFGASEKFSLIDITDSPAMKPWTMAGHYDKPIQRRMAEEGGVARGTFATAKRRASARIHADGIAALAPASVVSITEFAAREGRTLPHGARPMLKRRHRAVIQAAKRLRAEPLVAPLARRRRAMIHLEPEFGSLLFRWAVSVVRPRYSTHQPAVVDAVQAAAPTTNLKSSAGV
jgi:hypothetical protein